MVVQSLSDSVARCSGPGIGTRVFFCDAHSPWQRGSNEPIGAWCYADGFDGSKSGGLLSDSENMCRHGFPLICPRQPRASALTGIAR